METILSRHKNIVILVGALLLQFLLLAVQIKRPTEQGPVRLIRIVTIRTITPFEKAIVHSRNWIGDMWRSYIYVRGLRNENEMLQDENARLRLEQVRMVQDASQAQRLQALFRFKEQYINTTVAAQVIGTSGTDQSRLLYIDKGSSDGIRPDMAVIAPGGVVGKIVRVQSGSAQVLEINDQSSGVGAILEKSRLQGILKGMPSGEAMLHYIMSDEKVEVGEQVLTSGGDRIFPKGLPIGVVTSVNPGSDMFLNIRVKPAARLNRIEEVLVITSVNEKQPDLLPEGPQRAADILAARLPSITIKQPDAAATQPGATQAQGTQQQPQTVSKPQGATAPQGTASNTAKPQNQGASAPASSRRGPANAAPGAAKPANAADRPVKRITDNGNGTPAPKQNKPAKPAGVSQ